MAAQEIDHTFLHGMMHDRELRIVPATVLSRHRVPPHLLRTRVRSELNDQRRATRYIHVNDTSVRRLAQLTGRRQSEKEKKGD